MRIARGGLYFFKNNYKMIKILYVMQNVEKYSKY